VSFPKACFSIAIVSLLSLQVVRANTNIFTTSFESGEGYVAGLPLNGQQGWIKDRSGGNGIETGWSTGQSAYIGRQPPTGGDEYLFLWKPINYDAVAAGTPEVKFSVKMSIEDSSNGAYDNFRWFLFNSQGDDLFEIIFDNNSLNILFWPDSGPYQNTGVTFQNAQTYTFTVTLNFAANTWGASLDNTLLATNQPITTVGSPLDFGDMDALWVLNVPTFPGNNAMLFDDYSVVGITGVPPQPPAAPTITVLSKTPTDATLRVFGENGKNFAVDSSSGLSFWTPLTTNTCSGGYFDAVDSTVTGNPIRFYRARWVP
jgi:hypothetical protein